MSNTVHVEAIQQPGKAYPPDGAQHSLGMVGSSASESQNWQSRFWDNERHISLQFATTEELDAMIDWLRDLPEMRNLPRVHLGDNTIIVPAQAVEAFRKKGFKFVIGQVTSMGDLPSEKANRIRTTG